jgi:hypothetical protein
LPQTTLAYWRMLAGIAGARCRVRAGGRWLAGGLPAVTVTVTVAVAVAVAVRPVVARAGGRANVWNLTFVWG